MARLGFIVFSLVLLFGSSVALISEGVIASLILLNTLLGSSNVELAVAAAIGEASSLAAKSGVITKDLPANWPKFSIEDVTKVPQIPIPTPEPDLKIEQPTEVVESRKRRRREAPETDEEKPKRGFRIPFLSSEVGSTVPVNDKSFQDLQDEIFDNMGVIAHDMASELSMHLGLKPHTLEAVVLHEEDAPSFPKVLESVAKRFHAPKLLLSGLHSLIEKTDYFENNYELEDDAVHPTHPPSPASYAPDQSF